MYQGKRKFFFGAGSCLRMRESVDHRKTRLQISWQRLSDLTDSDSQLIADRQRGNIQYGRHFLVCKTFFFHKLEDKPALWRQLPDDTPDLLDEICGNTHFHRTVELDYSLHVQLLQADHRILIMLGNIIEREIP